MYPFRDFDCVIRPDDFNLLQRVFDNELARAKLKIDMPEADALAKRLIALYQEGLRDPVDLLERLNVH
ncbi:hypothetical protein ILFOPFJJ_05894 [Ensifer psoraleae]|uniref:hypothetical protein n=1 Tax=Sinorhizobium TaxID=28105 RepID=UPI001AED1DB5|nr:MULTISPECIES: hypothetical protein [Sinorhizobium]MDK1388736.1 hypothetical protein [Sinorhizobium sp. 7-81]NRP74971.1 hypothetical protein [Sinorhizobium psoraleae]